MKKIIYVFIMSLLCSVFYYGNVNAEENTQLPIHICYQYCTLGGDCFIHYKLEKKGHDGVQLQFSRTKAFSSADTKKKNIVSQKKVERISLKIKRDIYKYVRMRTYQYNTDKTRKEYSAWSRPVKVSKTGESTVDLWIGDSRTVGMFAHLFPKYLAHIVGRDYPQRISYGKCIAKDGEGYYWMAKNAYGTILKKIKYKPDSVLVVNMGVNDYMNVSAQTYIRFYQKLQKMYPKLRIYCMSINPVKKRYKYYRQTTIGIARMNKAFKEAFGDQYIDVASYLKAKGFQTTPDGLHYTTQTYLDIHNYVLQYIKCHEQE